MTLEYKQLLRITYTLAEFPHHLADSGPWMICKSAKNDLCAAIPRDRASGHLPSQYGILRDVQRMIQRGELQPA